MRRMLTGIVVLMIFGFAGAVGSNVPVFGENINAGLIESAETLGPARSVVDDPWSPAELIQPAELAKMLTGEHKPVVLQIGIVHLYKLGHTPGSKFAGPASSADGLEALKKEVQGLDRNNQLIYYCGCCPWGDCPNIRPAYKALRELGFKKIRVLYLPTNFTQDWAMKGFPVEKS